MNPHTKQQFTKLQNDMVSEYGLSSVADLEHFAIEPSKVQKITDMVQESDDFLQNINMVVVPEMSGETLQIGVPNMIAGNTDTNKNDRKPNELHSLGSQRYLCEVTDFDHALKYATLDVWSHRPDFRNKISSQITRAEALSLISVGFNGVSRAVDTNPAKNTLGEDVAVGWLQKLRDNNPDSVHSDNDIVLSDETNLDVIVHLAKELLGPVEKQDPSLVVIVGDELLSKNTESLFVKNNATPTEKKLMLAGDVVQTFGGLPAITAPFFPSRGVLVTSLENLSIYTHTSVRKQIINNPARRRVDTFVSKAIDFIVENYNGMSYIESDKVKFEGE